MVRFSRCRTPLFSSPSLFVSFNMAWPFAKPPSPAGSNEASCGPTRQLAWALIARQRSVRRVAALRPNTGHYEMHLLRRGDLNRP